MRCVLVALLCCVCAGSTVPAAEVLSIADAAARVEQLSFNLPPPLARGFRERAAEALKPRYPDIARKLAPAAEPAPASASGTPPQPTAQGAAITQEMRRMRGLPTDADRARLAIKLAGEVRLLPGGAEKLALAQVIGSLTTEGDLGKEALSAVAETIFEAAHQTTPDPSPYIQLALLIRYEHIPAPGSDPGLDAADAVLALRELIIAGNDFSLSALDGKTYTLSGLRGKVVLINFWATWCGPCRKELPDMEKLYKQYAPTGFLVLGISDEEREKVAPFVQKEGYTFPILLDPGGKVNEAFAVSGVPKSFLFDRKGRLVSEAIDMRTERQFRDMLKLAGLD